jgi:hypothetical protein
MNKGREMLKRKPTDSLLCLSNVYRKKIETLEKYRMSEAKRNPRPEHW